MRPMGKITEDMEKLLIEMIDQHDLQRYEIVSLVDGWIKAHREDNIETCSETEKQPEIRYDWESKGD